MGSALFPQEHFQDGASRSLLTAATFPPRLITHCRDDFPLQSLWLRPFTPPQSLLQSRLGKPCSRAGRCLLPPPRSGAFQVLEGLVSSRMSCRTQGHGSPLPQPGAAHLGRAQPSTEELGRTQSSPGNKHLHQNPCSKLLWSCAEPRAGGQSPELGRGNGSRAAGAQPWGEGKGEGKGGRGGGESKCAMSVLQAALGNGSAKISHLHAFLLIWES